MCDGGRWYHSFEASLNALVTSPFQQNAKKGCILWTLVSLFYCSVLSWPILWVSATKQSQHFEVEFSSLSSFLTSLAICFIPLQLPLALNLLFSFLTFCFSVPFIALLALVTWCFLPFKQTCIWLSNCLRSENSVPFRPGFITLG